MPHTISADASIYWKELGSGPPVLLIMGLTFTHDMWFRVLPALTPRCRVLLFDNRGVGRSACPPGPYSIRQMAADAVAVLDAAGVSSAHVIGASMGGMIAQELAINFPARVRSLLLACTSYGGVVAKWPRFTTPGGLARDVAFLPMLYAPGTPKDRILEDLTVQRASTCTFRSLCNQLSGILPWTSYKRLPQIRVPALVIHGDRDRLVPPENGRVVASRIPGAEFRLIPNAGHMLLTDQPGACQQLLIEFLEFVNRP